MTDLSLKWHLLLALASKPNNFNWEIVNHIFPQIRSWLWQTFSLSMYVTESELRVNRSPIILLGAGGGGAVCMHASLQALLSWETGCPFPWLSRHEFFKADISPPVVVLAWSQRRRFSERTTVVIDVYWALALCPTLCSFLYVYYLSNPYDASLRGVLLCPFYWCGRGMKRLNNFSRWQSWEAAEPELKPNIWSQSCHYLTGHWGEPQKITCGIAETSFLFYCYCPLVPLFLPNVWPYSEAAILRVMVRLRETGSVFSTSKDTYPKMQADQKSVWLLNNQPFQSRGKTRTLSSSLLAWYFQY